MCAWDALLTNSIALPNHLDRIDRLKAARTEAIKEIEALKAQKNAEFAAFEKQVERYFDVSSRGKRIFAHFNTHPPPLLPIFVDIHLVFWIF